MKYAIAGILLTDIAILLWAKAAGLDVVMMAFALLCVSFFGSLPIVAGVLTRRKAQRAQKPPGVPIKLPGPDRSGPRPSG